MIDLGKFSPRSFDWILFTSAFLLIAMGLSAIYSVDLSRGGELFFFKKQLLSLGIGLGVVLVASLMQHSLFRSYAKLVYGLSVLLLTAVLLFGATVNGTKGWFRFAGFSFQPVEVAKIAIIFILAYVVYHFGRRFERPLFFVGTGLMTLVLMGLIMLQPDLGSALMIGAIWFAVMLLVGVRRLYVTLLVGAGILAAVLAWFFLLQPYQKDRVLTFLNPERDPLRSGYNITQATIAIGSGEFFGRGLGRGSQSQMRFLPEAQTDFVFSVIAEELGFLGVVVFVSLYGVMLWRLLHIAMRAPDDFSSTAVCGIAVLFFTQFVVNVGANVGLLPITGVTLPLVSYGGSSLIVNLFLIGVAESMVVKRY